MRRSWRTTLTALACACATAAPALAQDMELKFTTLAAPAFSASVEVLVPWATRLNEQAKGAFKIEVIPGLAVANHANWYDRLINDVTQITFGTGGSVTGKFKKLHVVALPFLGERSEDLSVALHRLYKTGMLDDEYDQIVPLMLAVFPQSGLHYRAEPKSIDNLNGLKVITISKVLSEVALALGGAPVSTPIFEAHQSLQRGVADAAMVNYSSFEPYKLAEVTRYHLEMSLGSTPGMIAMSRARYLALPAAGRAAIDANAAEKDTRVYGQYWDRGQAFGRKLVSDPAVHKVVKLPDPVAAAWRQKLSAIETEWAQANPNGVAVLARFKSIVADVVAGR